MLDVYAETTMNEQGQNWGGHAISQYNIRYKDYKMTRNGIELVLEMESSWDVII